MSQSSESGGTLAAVPPQLQAVSGAGGDTVSIPVSQLPTLSQLQAVPVSQLQTVTQQLQTLQSIPINQFQTIPVSQLQALAASAASVSRHISEQEQDHETSTAPPPHTASLAVSGIANVATTMQVQIPGSTSPGNKSGKGKVIDLLLYQLVAGVLENT